MRINKVPPEWRHLVNSLQYTEHSLQLWAENLISAKIHYLYLFRSYHYKRIKSVNCMLLTVN